MRLAMRPLATTVLKTAWSLQKHRYRKHDKVKTLAGAAQWASWKERGSFGLVSTTFGTMGVELESDWCKFNMCTLKSIAVQRITSTVGTGSTNQLEGSQLVFYSFCCTVSSLRGNLNSSLHFKNFSNGVSKVAREEVTPCIIVFLLNTYS